MSKQVFWGFLSTGKNVEISFYGNHTLTGDVDRGCELKQLSQWFRLQSKLYDSLHTANKISFISPRRPMFNKLIHVENLNIVSIFVKAQTHYYLSSMTNTNCTLCMISRMFCWDLTFVFSKWHHRKGQSQPHYHATFQISH